MWTPQRIAIDLDSDGADYNGMMKIPSHGASEDLLIFGSDHRSGLGLLQARPSRTLFRGGSSVAAVSFRVRMCRR